MERIVDTLEYQKVLPESYADKLKLLGMRENDFPLIPSNAIQIFLTKHLKEFFKERGNYSNLSIEFEIKQSHGGVRHKVYCPILKKIKKRFLFWTIEKSIKSYTGLQWWDEMPIERYTGNPPEHVLTSALRAKELGYTDLRIVTTNCNVVEDPLLIAFKNNKRYLVDWWDKDFTAEEIIALVEDQQKEK